MLDPSGRIGRRFRAALALAAALAGAPSLAGASPVSFTGTLSLLVGTLGGGWSNQGNTYVPFAYDFSGTADVTGGQLLLPAGAASETGIFYGIDGFPLGLFTGVVVTVSNGGGSFGPAASGTCPGPIAGAGACVAGGGFGGTMPLAGLFQVKGALGFGVPLSVFGAGVGFGPVHAPLSTVLPSNAQGAPWTTRTARVTTTGAPMGMYTGMGTRSGAVGAMSSTLTLVTPVHLNVADLARLPAFATLSLHFVPEPASATLLLLGVAGLALARSRRGAR